MNFISSVLGIGFMLFSVAFGADSASGLPDNRFAINVSNGDLHSVLELVAKKAGLRLDMNMEHDANALVTINKPDASIREILEELSHEQQLEYSVEGNTLVITKRKLSQIQGRAHLVVIHNASALDVMTKLKGVTAPDERLFVDERSNNLIFLGSSQNFARIQELVAFFDAPLKQVMIEAQIIETSDSFMRQLGVAMSSTTQRGVFTTLSSTPTVPSGPTITGVITTAGLSASILAAESSGEAKVISRPKVMTLNNRSAKIESGTSFSVRTLVTPVAPTEASSGTTSPNTGAVPGTLTSGITTISAGLSLDILPTIMDDGMVKLIVSINDSQPDGSVTVDGIPGVSNNLANTSVVVKNGQTVVIAGLVQQTNTKTRSGVPILSSIPLLGALFRTDSVNKSNNELVVFITPTVDESSVAMVH